MPKLDEYIQIGLCNYYGDGDFAISMRVENLSKKQINSLMSIFFHAQRMTWDIWYEAQKKTQIRMLNKEIEQ